MDHSLELTNPRKDHSENWSILGLKFQRIGLFWDLPSSTIGCSRIDISQIGCSRIELYNKNGHSRIEIP